MKVTIVEGIRPTLMPEGPEIERKIFGSDVEIMHYGLVGPQEYQAAFEDADAVIARPGTPFSREMILSLRKAQIIVSLGVGYDHICLNTAKEKAIPVCNVPDYGTDEVADSTIAMLLAHHRKIFLFKHIFEWDWRIHKPICRMRDMQIGIIGLGRIGMAVAMRLKPFGCRVSFYDPYKPRGIEKALALERAYQIGQLISQSDVVTVHTPFNMETVGMVNKEFLELMKPDAILLNTARGGIFQSVDLLYDFLKKRPDFRIGTDVWPQEPPSDDPLLKAWRDREPWLGDRLIICPHSAFYSEKSIREIRIFAAEIVKTVLDGGEPYNVVGIEV